MDVWSVHGVFIVCLSHTYFHSLFIVLASLSSMFSWDLSNWNITWNGHSLEWFPWKILRESMIFPIKLAVSGFYVPLNPSNEPFNAVFFVRNAWCTSNGSVNLSSILIVETRRPTQDGGWGGFCWEWSQETMFFSFSKKYRCFRKIIQLSCKYS